MAPELRRAALVPFAALALLASAAHPAFALRFVNWNVLNYPGSTAAVREPAYRAVLTDIQPDVLVVQEMTGASQANQFLANVLNTIQPGEWALVPYNNGPDTNNAFYYKPAAVTFLDATYLPTDLRNIADYHFRLHGYTTAAAELHVLSMHLKASMGTTNEHQRRVEAIVARTYANNLPPNTNFVYCGDMNVYANTDSGYVIFLENEADNDGRAHDPLNRQGAWNNNGAFADVHTQSTRTGTLTPGDGGATGGLDDRFDQVLFSSTMDDGHGLDWIPGKYKPWGNDGHHFNLDINAAPVDPTITQAVADALQRTSDHLPVVVDFAGPALSQIAPASLDFGTVIVGAPPPSLGVDVSNVAALPADGLDFTVAAPAGFSAASGPYAVPAGAAPRTVSVTLDTSAPGAKSGDLQVSSDDPETPVRLVPLAGTVLAHAAPSLSSDPATLVRAIDWGTQPVGGFSEMTFAVYNTATAPAARAELSQALVEGGNGRFTLSAPADPPLLVGADSVTFSVAFHDSDATQDSLYEAQVVIPTKDESGIVGGTDLDSLHVTLAATVGSSPVAVEPALPAKSGLLFAGANPARGTLRFELDLAHDADARVELFDVQGKKAGTLARGFRSAGRYGLSWSAQASRGRPLMAGVYFVRYELDGVKGVKRVVLLP
ncbi:MAG TPA: choice-of-anchor D domain-containing protein [Candidatus Eisenbacteria bacterium]|nr:choice-of-anchor D domain-containing protein [Candidatus Eisenbacteria bacterium]